jgi:hypothetical protein
MLLSSLCFSYAQVPKRERITLRCSALAKERQQNVNRDSLLCPSYYNHSIDAYSQLPLSLRAFLGDSEVALNDLEKGQVQTSVSKYFAASNGCGASFLESSCNKVLPAPELCLLTACV